jgi:hypothetical protein
VVYGFILGGFELVLSGVEMVSCFTKYCFLGIWGIVLKGKDLSRRFQKNYQSGIFIAQRKKEEDTEDTELDVDGGLNSGFCYFSKINPEGVT